MNTSPAGFGGVPQPLFSHGKNSVELSETARGFIAVIIHIFSDRLFFASLVGEEGPRIPGGKVSRVCFLKILSSL
jgi:hypothetical protein